MNEEMFCDPTYFGQLHKQAESSLLEVKKKAAGFLPQILHADISLRSKINSTPLMSSKTATITVVSDLQTQIGKLKNEVSGMLQELVLAEAAIMSMDVIARESPSGGNPKGPPHHPPVQVENKGSGEASLPALSLAPPTLGDSPETAVEHDEGWSSSFDMSDPMDMSVEESSDNIVTNSALTPEENGSSSKPVSGRKKLPVICCKLCGVQFKYRLSLFKHFKEHTEHNISTHNYEDFVVYQSSKVGGPPSRNRRVPTKLVNFETLPLAPSLPPEDRSYTCVVCNKHFNRPNKLVRHMQIHDPDRPRVECNYCSRSFTRYDTMYYHIRTQHPEVKAGHGFAENGEKLTRKRVDGGSTAYKCTECQGMFSLMTSFKSHDCPGAKMQPEAMVRCIHCNQAFPSFDHLADHQVKVHAYSCKVCCKTFLHEAYLNVHMVIHSGPGKFTCQQEECQDTFEQHEEYLKHIKSHPGYMPYRCTHCRRSFAYPSLIVAHTLSCSVAKSSVNTRSTNATKPEGEGGKVAAEGTLIDNSHSLITNTVQDVQIHDTYTLTVPVTPTTSISEGIPLELPLATMTMPTIPVSTASSATSRSLATLPTSSEDDHQGMEPMVGLQATAASPLTRANLPTH
jgi:DNA-directed RNA polymerase subunit RPC12/RpoP